MEKRLLVICGPTATGKTNLAIRLSKLFNGEIVSADSRQVFRGMNIGTGKDLPVNSKKVTNFVNKIVEIGHSKLGYYLIQRVKLWGYDLVDPGDEFSVSHYMQASQMILKDIWKREKLPVLVGGTGLYIKSIVDGIGTSNIPRDNLLRKSMEGKTPQELFEILRVINPLKSASLNISDRNNTRRLIRAIEIASSKNKKRVKVLNSLLIDSGNVLKIGLTGPKDILDKRIKKRVEERIAQGLEKEIRGLLAGGVKWDMQSMNTLGYKEWKPYFEGEISFSDLVKKWSLDEIHYAKRQITWFKKEKKIKWFDITAKDWQEEVEKLVKKWQNRIN